MVLCDFFSFIAQLTEGGGRALVSESRDPGSILTDCTLLCPYWERHINSPEYWLKPRRQWFRPDMTEKSLTGMLKLNTNKAS